MYVKISTQYVFLALAMVAIAGRSFAQNDTVNYQALLNDPVSPCGYTAPSMEQIRAMQEQQRQQTDRFSICRTLCAISQRFCKPINIRTHVFNVHAADGTGKQSEADINQMVADANERFAGLGFYLDLKSVKYIAKTSWYVSADASSDEASMKSHLKVGGLNVLTVYVKLAYSSGGSRVCGYAYLAQYAEGAGDKDGVVIDQSCLLDGTTFAHEVGHFLNLMHTFDGGCDPGDLVDDTNAQSTYVGRIQQCPATYPDSCPSKPGLDPLDNLMDYSPLQCPHGFTKGQGERMQDGWYNFRYQGFRRRN